MIFIDGGAIIQIGLFPYFINKTVISKPIINNPYIPYFIDRTVISKPIISNTCIEHTWDLPVGPAIMWVSIAGQWHPVESGSIAVDGIWNQSV